MLPGKGGDSKSQSLYTAMKWPIVAYTVMACATIYSWTGGSWFTQHPISMIIAFVGLAANATLIKKIGGYENTKTHGIMMVGATLVAAYGFYVIYTQKLVKYAKQIEKNPDFNPHFLTLHGKIGLAVMVGYTSLAIFGAVALHPDYGFLKRQHTVRFIHKWAGRALTATSWICCVLGLQSMQKTLAMQLAWGVPLLIFGFFVLL